MDYFNLGTRTLSVCFTAKSLLNQQPHHFIVWQVANRVSRPEECLSTNLDLKAIEKGYSISCHDYCLSITKLEIAAWANPLRS